jgi:hypothetical protein
MAVVNLTFATTRAAIKVLRQALASDPLFQPDKTGPSRQAETIVLDSWGYQVRDFPVVVVEGVPGKNRRMDFGDKVRPFFGVPLAEEPGGTQSLRTFDVPLALVPGRSTLELRYNGDATLMDPLPPFKLPVQQKTVGPNLVNYVQLAGPNIGPATTFPLANFEASVSDQATGQVFGGWYDMNLMLTGCARSTQGRQQLADRIMSLMWFEKKKALRKLGIVVLDVQHVGYRELPYGADQLYYTKFSASVATEFEAIVQFAETVQDISVVGTAVST